MAEEERICQVFYALDFDRCLGDTSKFHSVLEESVYELTGIFPSEIARAREESKLREQTFDTASYVIHMLDRQNARVRWEDIRLDMIKRARQRDMLEPGAARLLARLDEHNIPYGILTHGKLDWQHTKLVAAKLEHVPHIITLMRHKAMLIRTWRQVDGTFWIPPELVKGKGRLIARNIVQIDDKATNFYGLPPGVAGYCLAWSEREQLVSGTGEMPAAVKTINSLDEVEVPFVFNGSV